MVPASKRARRKNLRRAAGGAFLAALSVSSAARAQTPPSNLPQAVAARGLYEQAVAAMGRGDYEAAYPMLEEAVRLEPAALGARLALAECYEAADRLASAWGTYGIVEQEAVKLHQQDRQEKAHARVAALEPRLARMVVDVPERVKVLPGLEIKRDGAPVGPAQWGVPLPADKGSHVVEVAALGRATVRATFEVLADGVTARATLAEPPPATAGTPWWSVPAPPPTRRAAVQLPPIEPPPPPPERGRPVVDLRGGARLELREAAPSGGNLVCDEGCGVAVDGRAHEEFFVGGEGILESDRFRLDDRIGRVEISVSPGSAAARTGGIVVTAIGGAAALGCGVGMPVAARADAPTPGLVATCLIGGAVAVGGGLYLLLTTRTTYAIAAHGRALALRF